MIERQQKLQIKSLVPWARWPAATAESFLRRKGDILVLNMDTMEAPESSFITQ
jgi:hypothetical protein